MLPLNTVTLLVNGLTLALALGFLLIVLWNDFHKPLNQFFAIFLFLVTLWNVGSLLTQAIILLDPRLPVANFALSLMEVGFTGSSVAIYVLVTVLVGAHTKRFSVLAFISLGLIVIYQIFLIVNRTTTTSVLDTADFSFRFVTLSILFYLIFDGMTLYLLWRYRRKIRSYGLVIGVVIFVVGQSLGFLNPRLQVVYVATTTSAFGALILSFSFLRQEIIVPLAERISQVESMHRVSLAITSQIAIDTLLNEIATQAVGWLAADGAGIFLKRDDLLELATVYNLPRQYVGMQVALGVGVAGSVAGTHRSIYLENYARDWRGDVDLPLARETFGSVICVPLSYAGEVIGTLMVIAGGQGRLLERDDVHLLELLGAQAAVAIAHSRLFAEQRALTREVEIAHSQLETVLVSTENPVIAVDRRFKLIFANPAAIKLFDLPQDANDRPITDILPAEALPEFKLGVVRELLRSRAHVYEISLGNKVFLCQLASLGGPKATGWVAVLNDVTQLKELDRLKSEMVRWASHDLKNPLTGAMLHLDLLREDLAELDNPDIHDTVAVIEKQLKRMHRIIRGILDLERLKVASVAGELCRAALIVKNTVEELQDFARDKNVHLHVEIEDETSVFWGDQNQFERALINLTENAIKFTGINGDVAIKVRKENGHVVFEVKDDGIGIPQSLQDRIFDRFFRGGQSGQRGAGHVSGSGLGLSLVKTIVENHKGKIWLTSQESVGTTFFVSIPSANDSQAL